MPKIAVYGTPVSTYVRTVRLLLEEANADYDLRSVDIFNGENMSAEYLAKHPFGKVPTVEVDEEVIYESAAITSYLDMILAGGKFGPAEPLPRSRMHQIVAIIDNYLYPSAILTIVIQRLIVPSQGGQTNEAAVKAAVVPTQKAISAIEALTVGSSYLLGSEVSIADFYLIPIFIYLSKTPEFDHIMAQAPKLQAWWQKVCALPTVKKVCG
ncbi:glutathione S-transferase family protein [Cyanobacteria bacterium FACHB-63]|nr:glutathione S-transferase family protein [Cyanobacteria bacterium FACHB-63]